MNPGLRCPSCDISGELGDRLSLFADRGTTDDGSRLVRCGNCGAGLDVRRGWLGKARTRLVDPDEWARVEQQWERRNPLPSTAAPPLPDARTLAEDLAGRGDAGPHVVHQLAEATELTEDEARALLGEFRTPS